MVHVVHRGVLAYAKCSTEVDVVLVVAQGFTAVPVETHENVLSLTACVTRGGSNRDSVVGAEAAFTDGEALRGDGELPSPPLPLPASRARASRASPYVSCTTESAAPALNESRSRTERILPLAQPNKSKDVGRAGCHPDPDARGLGARTGVSVGEGAGDDAGDGGRGCCCGNWTDAGRELVGLGRPGSSSRFSTIGSVDSGVAPIHLLIPTAVQLVPETHILQIREEHTLVRRRCAARRVIQCQVILLWLWWGVHVVPDGYSPRCTLLTFPLQVEEEGTEPT